jgi:WhiB family redox-sensing transcriptional regulator
MISRPKGGIQRDAEAGHWTERALCREPGTDPELFFPVGETGLAARRQVAAAKAVCARCPVMDQCRDWAVRTGQPEGIWGGTTPDERRHLRRRRLRVA